LECLKHKKCEIYSFLAGSSTFFGNKIDWILGRTPP
jgi:hypothetical protein